MLREKSNEMTDEYIVYRNKDLYHIKQESMIIYNNYEIKIKIFMIEFGYFQFLYSFILFGNNFLY